MLRLHVSAALVAAAVFSCSSPPIDVPPGDSGVPLEDAGPTEPEDAGADAGTEPDAGEPIDAGVPVEPIAWGDCALHSEGGSPTRAECARVAVPLRAEGGDGGTIEIFVKRWAPDGGTRERQLWMLNGGPGASGMAYENIAEAIGVRALDIEWYLPDHRGTGRSNRLGCVEEAPGSEWGRSISPNEWPSCIANAQAAYGDTMTAYSTTNAANDLGVLIPRSKREGQKVFVYGASYGTYWAHRYLQLYPSQADGVILDSMVPSPGSLAEQDSDANEAGQLFFDGPCKSDATCAAKLGADPWATANATLAKLKTGHCSGFAAPYGLPAHVLLRRVFGSMMMGFSLRPYIAAALYRADRCNAADQAALARLMQVFFGTAPSAAAALAAQQGGWILSNNILFSELWPTAAPLPTAADLLASRENSVVSRDVTSSMDVLVGTWPTYARDRWVDAWAVTTTPMLMLAGGLDPATTYRKQLLVKPHFTAPGQHWVEFPLGAHGVITSSPTNANTSCGTAVMLSFLRSPLAAPDTACKSDLRGVDFVGNSATAQQLFGTTDMWE
ncbi:MAG: alpha/beta hydrolase [Myxococcaceae bacterium]|nr:alpha/beta hydrolase [Myxococcaceae bacterium]